MLVGWCRRGKNPLFFRHHSSKFILKAELIQTQQTLGLLEADYDKLSKESAQLQAELAPISTQAEQLKKCYLEQDALLRLLFSIST